MSTDLPDLLPVRRPHRPLWLRVLCFVGALVFLGLGVLGWLVPVVTGIPFYAVAIVLLAVASDRTRERLNALERRLPHDTRVAMRRWLARIPLLHRHITPAEHTSTGHGRADNA